MLAHPVQPAQQIRIDVVTISIITAPIFVVTTTIIVVLVASEIVTTTMPVW